MPSLTSSKVIQTLKSRARKDSHAAALYGVIYPIVNDVTPLLEFIRHSFPAYPKHGVDHSIRILERIGGILSDSALKSLSSYELFCLVLAALFHDAGMVAPDSAAPNDEAIRIVHHRRSAELFLKYFPDRLALLSNQRMASTVAFAIESHGLSWEEMQSRPEFFKPETLDGEHIRPCVIAILLRIGDLLDLDGDRTSDLCLKHCASWYTSADAIAHNERHRYVKHFFYSPKRIEVDVECPTRTQYDIWFSWLEYLRLDIERANTYVFYDDLSAFRLPVPILKCQPSPDAKFELWPLRFEIDESGELWDVISKSVYTGKYDYVRELIQNSIDACLRKIYESPDATITDPSPRNWTLSGYRPTILLIVSRETEQLAVSDNGIGMDRHTVQNFLFRVAGSGMKRQGKNRPYKFPSIATFGVGFISVLTRANKLRLITKRAPTAATRSFPSICIRLDANLRDAIVEKAPESSEGTSILLRLRDPQYLRQIRSYVHETFRYPSVGIHLLDWDEFTAVVGEVKEKQIPVDLGEYELVKSYFEEGTGSIEGLTDAVERLVNRIRRLKEKFDLGEEDDPKNKQGRKELPLTSYVPNPVFHVPAQEPERLPISSSFHFMVGKGATLGRARAIKGTKPEPSLYRALVVVPVQFTDNALGVEWRSLHSLLVAEGAITQRISFVRTARFGSREFLVRNDADVYDSIAMELDESEDNPYDLVERMRMRSEFQPEYDTPEDDAFYGTILVSSRDGIMRYSDVDLARVNITSARKGDKDYEADQEFLSLSERENFFETHSTSNTQVLDIVEWYKNNRQAVYQDGIRLPVELCDIAPIGSAVGVANLLADSRMTYNVSRNAIDESEDKLKAWRSGTSKLILKRIAVIVANTLDHLGIDYSWKDLWNGEADTNFSRLDEWMELETRS